MSEDALLRGCGKDSPCEHSQLTSEPGGLAGQLQSSEQEAYTQAVKKVAYGTWAGRKEQLVLTQVEGRLHQALALPDAL